MKTLIKKTTKLSYIFIKEQLKEPVSFFWILLSPSLMFYFLTLIQKPHTSTKLTYEAYSAYYYGYVAASVAFFGFAFYLIGRRESGFIRSFAYLKEGKVVLLAAQLTSYSTISVLYCALLYLLTKPLFGAYDAVEFIYIALRFYACFLMFCGGALPLVSMQLSFQNSHTLLSALLFLMLAVLMSARLTTNKAMHVANQFNPLNLASEIMLMGGVQLAIACGAISVCLLTLILLAVRLLPVNPAWSRY